MITAWLILSLITYFLIIRHRIWQTNKMGAILMILVSPVGLLALVLDMASDRREAKNKVKKNETTFQTYQRKNSFDDFMDNLDDKL